MDTQPHLPFYSKLTESSSTGKRVPHVVAFLADYIDRVPEKVTTLLIHADNCVAQNKNKFVIQFFHMLVAIGRFTNIRFMFMLPGHTKFSVDGVFGVIKKKYFRQVGVYTPAQFAEVVEGASRMITVRRMGRQCWTDWKSVLMGVLPAPKTKHLTQFQIFDIVRDVCGGDVSMKVYRTSEDFKNGVGLTWDVWDNVLTAQCLEERVSALREEHMTVCPPLSLKRRRQLLDIADALVVFEMKGTWYQFIGEHGGLVRGISCPLWEVVPLLGKLCPLFWWKSFPSVGNSSPSSLFWQFLRIFSHKRTKRSD